MGYDVHKLTEDRKLILGGVEIPYEKGLLGHSDADVLLHAIMDALLGAAALGDIGKHFPDIDPQYKGISSIKLLEHVAALLDENGYVVENIDATIIAQRPKMRPYIFPHLPTFLSAMKVPEEEKVDCSFAVIDPLLQKNSGVWRMKSDWGEDKLCVSETEDSEGVFPIDALTQLLFGTVPIREIAERTDVMATERLVAELEKICKLNRVFLNEIV